MEVSGGDVLVQCNALEILRSLAAVQHGRDYIDREGVAAKLVEQLCSTAVDPLAILIVPSIVKFVGTLLGFHPGLMCKFSTFMEFLFNSLDDPDMSLVLVCIETLAFIASNKLGNVLSMNKVTFLSVSLLSVFEEH